MREVFSAKLMVMGFGYVCAHCEKLHRAFGKGINNCGYEIKGRDCGGPIGQPARAFPEYEGPLSRQHIASQCFRCGKDADYMIGVGADKYVGVCKTHIEMTKSDSPKAMVQVDMPRCKTA